jgi:hypothetical protein
MAGLAPLVITTDGNRAGAVEQLAAYYYSRGSCLADPSLPVASSCALLVPSSPVGPVQDGIRL